MTALQNFLELDSIVMMLSIASLNFDAMTISPFCKEIYFLISTALADMRK